VFPTLALLPLQDELARKRMETEHEKQRVRNVELVQLQEEAGRRQEQEKAAIAQQIEAERRATEKYKAQVQGWAGGTRAVQGRVEAGGKGGEIVAVQLRMGAVQAGFAWRAKEKYQAAGEGRHWRHRCRCRHPHQAWQGAGSRHSGA